MTVDELLSAATAKRTVDLAEAIRLCSLALEREPNHGAGLATLALLNAEFGDHDAAVAALNRLRDADPSQAEETQAYVDDWSLRFLGGAHIQLDYGDVEKAAANYDLYIKYNPDCHEGYTGRGNVLTAQRDFEKAAEAFSTALRLNPNAGMAYDGLGRLQIEMKDWDAAIESLTKAIDIFPEHYPTYEARSIAFEAKGDDVLAQKDRESALVLRGKEE